MAERRWFPGPEDERLIVIHLERQEGVAEGFVKLDDGRIVRVGSEAEGEGDDECQ